MAASIDVLCCGIIVADHVCAPIPRLPTAGELVTTDEMILTIGGCAANAAVDLARLNARPTIAGRVGDDAFGRIIIEMLGDHLVETSALKVARRHPTSQTMIVNVRGEDRRFIHILGANAAFSAKDIPVDLVRRARIVYVGGYLLMPGLKQVELVRVFQAARAAGARTVLDVALTGTDNYFPELAPLLSQVDVFLPNRDEAEVLTGESDPLRQAGAFRRRGARTVVITMGGAGSLLVSDKAQLKAGVYPVEFLDGSGGGDAFAAGFMYGMLHEMNAEDCLRVASALGASCVRAIGTTPGVFNEAECLDFMQRHRLPLERV